MKNLALISSSVLPFLASAHAGHGTIETGFAHYLTSPVHLFGLAAVTTFAVVVYRIRRKKKSDA